MMKKIKARYLVILSFLIIIAAIGIFTRVMQVKAANDYYFVFNNQSMQVGKQAELKTPTALLYVASSSSTSAQVVQWISSAPEIVSLSDTPYGSQFIQLNRERPGYATITAVFDDGFMVNCVIKVDLSFDYQKMLPNMITTTTTNERLLKFDEIGQEINVSLKYVDDEDSNTTGDGIDATFVDWSSSNVGVVRVTPTGKVIAEGAGTATLTVSTFTVSNSDNPMKITMNVVVTPKFSLSVPDNSGNTQVYNSSNNFNATPTIVNNVPSKFTLSSTATIGTNLKWVVYDISGGTRKLIAPGTSPKMTYNASQISGNVDFSNVKAGTYEVFAFSHPSYNEATNCPYAYMKLVVPLRIPNQNIVMNVNDTYNVLNNSNIPGVGVFGTPVYLEGHSNIALFNTNNYVIDARMEGTVQIKLDYNYSSGLFDPTTTVEPFIINVTVVDSLALSTSAVRITTGSKYYLNAIVSNPSIPVTWTSENNSIATVVDGEISGLKAGTVRITAEQIVGGVKKTASCVVTVQQSVTAITVAPSTANLGIGDFLTLSATVTPKIEGIKLNWQSSNPSVVRIINSYDLMAGIQAVSGGNAVISAINQDNVVVGYAHITVKQPVTAISLSETQAAVDMAMKKIQLRATIAPESATDSTVVWRSTDPTKASVDQNGLVTLLRPGTVTIVATSRDNPKVYADCNLTILIPTSSIELLERTKLMYTGGTDQLKYNLFPEDASNKRVVWTSTNPSVVTVDSVGKLSAKAVGTSVILLKSEDGGLSTFCTIEVKQSATDIKFDKTVLNLMVGKFDYLKATLSPADCTDTDIEWSTSDANVAKVDVNGRVTAFSAGTAFITAKTRNGFLTICRVNVTQPVTGVKASLSAKSIYKGERFELQANVEPSTATNQNVTWTSSNPSVASVSTRGEVLGNMGGVTIITCTTQDGNYVDACVVTVNELVTNVTLNHNSYILGQGNVFKLDATVSTQTATNKKVSWRSTNPGVAIVDQAGRVTGTGLGYATIVATATDGSGVEAYCEVRVVTLVSSITINKSSLSLYEGSRETLVATIVPSNATFNTPLWTSSNPAVAMVDGSGAVTALKAGSAIITADAQDGSGRKAICYVTVNARVPATGVTLQDTAITMVETEKKSVRIALIPSTSSDEVQWSSNNSSVASVDKNTGIITAKDSGSAMVTVMTDSGKKATIAVTVIGLNVKSMVTEQYTTYKQALSVEGANTKVKWTSQNQKVVEVSSNGTLSTRGVGTTTVTAQVNGRKLTCKITVQKQPIKKVKKPTPKPTKKPAVKSTTKKATPTPIKKSSTNKVKKVTPTKKPTVKSSVKKVSKPTPTKKPVVKKTTKKVKKVTPTKKPTVKKVVKPTKKPTAKK